MAPIKEPPTLYRSSLDAVSNLIDIACSNLFLEHGPYGSDQEINDSVEEFQNYLISQLPVSLFEALSEHGGGGTSRNRSSGGLQTWARSTSPLFWCKDPKIKLALFLHPSIRRFNVNANGNESVVAFRQDDRADELFWMSKIKTLTNLTFLDLNLVTTDEILILIGQCCPKLQVAHIMSRIRQDSAPPSALLDDASFSAGISLRFCVSDIGFRALINCKELRKVEINRVINNISQNRGISLNGVRDLIRGLPNLEHINYNSMGRILDHEDIRRSGQKFALKYYQEFDPLHVSVPTMINHCERLTNLSLAVAPTNAYNERNNNNNENNQDAQFSGPCNQIMRELANSELKLEVLELNYYPYGEAFLELLRSKGHRLEKLVFRSDENINSMHVRQIAEYCPNLQRLVLKDVSAEDHRGIPSVNSEILERNYFSKLRALQISGRMWNPSILLPLTLSNATEISTVFFHNMMYRSPMDSAFLRTMQMNKFANLDHLNLYSGCQISMPLVRSLVFDCPKLASFTFLQNDGIDSMEFEALKTEVSRKNLLIDLCLLEPFDLQIS